MQISFGENKVFTLVKEGKVNLTITKVELKPEAKPTSAYVTFEDKENGGFITNNYSFTKGDVSNRILGMLVSLVGNNGKWVETIDSDDLFNLKGAILECEVVHNQGKKQRDDGTYPTFANIKRFNKVVKEDTNNDLTDGLF